MLCIFEEIQKDYISIWHAHGGVISAHADRTDRNINGPVCPSLPILMGGLYTNSVLHTALCSSWNNLSFKSGRDMSESRGVVAHMSVFIGVSACLQLCV